MHKYIIIYIYIYVYAASIQKPKTNIYIYIYIYIYTSVNLCITCTKQSGAEQKLMPINDEQRQHSSSGHFERKK